MPERPMKSRKLKVIDYMGTYYATFDGAKMWKIDAWLQRLLNMCDGKRTFDDIVDEIAKIAGSPKDDIRIGLRPIIDDLKKSGMIEDA